MSRSGFCRRIPLGVAAFLAFSFGAATSEPVAAQEAAKQASIPYPGPTLITATAWEGLASISPAGGSTSSSGAAPGGGIRAMFSLEGFPVAGLVAETGAGYRWIDSGSTITPLPGATLSFGWRIAIPGLISVTPLAGTALEFACSSRGAEPVASAVFGARAAVRLSGREYLTLTPLMSIPFAGSIPATFALGLGLRSEAPWIVPVDEVHPRISVTPAVFSPDGDGVDDAVTVALAGKNPSAIKTWTVSIVAPDGTVFAGFSGNGVPPASIFWNGTATGEKVATSKLGTTSQAGATSKPGTNPTVTPSSQTAAPPASREIEPASDYRLVYATTDILGRARRSESSLTVDILVIREGDRYKVRVPDIGFPSYSWTISPKESRALLETNRKTLERIATLFSRFPEYTMTVEGHANAVNWNDAKKFEKEQNDELIPLSKKRAESVKAALVMLGIDETRIRTVGRGGTIPLADFADQKSAWKNRRVEFILEKQTP